MNNIALRTLIFVGVAVVCVGGAIATSRFTEPARLSDASLAGEEFYPDFQDPTKATALRVAAYDKDEAKVKVFNVEFKDGLWRIPSHHFYPADGEEQLARTAASVVGIKRGTFAGKTPTDHKRMGVLDPLDESITGTEGRGSRITLYQGEKALVDLIINKQEDSESGYYVRKAGDPQVYRAELSNLQISTKFADWIEPDLLKLERSKLSEMIVNRYHVDEERGAIVQEEINILNKESGAATWTLKDLDPETEKLNNVTVTGMVSALDDLKIVGVRPKPPGLITELTGRQGPRLNQLEVLQMQRAGYFLTPDGELVSNEGEILAGTSEGVRYSLRFGEIVSGTDLDIEVGSGDPDGDADSTDDSGETAEEDGASGSDLKNNRYLFITANFDESLLGERPQPPVKPEPPSETPAPAADNGDAPSETSDTDPASPAESDAPDTTGSESDSSSASPEPESPSSSDTDASASPDSDAEADPSADSPSDAEPAEAATEPVAETSEDAAEASAPEENSAQPADATEESATEPADPEAAQKAYEEALAQYEAESATYETRLQAYEEKVEAGQELAKDLNERFAAWYYVISADLFKKLQVSRSELVEPVPAAAAEPGDAEPESTGDTPSPDPDATDDATPSDDAGAPDESATDPASADSESDAGAGNPQPADPDSASDPGSQADPEPGSPTPADAPEPEPPAST